jgi:hypothetical protein
MSSSAGSGAAEVLNRRCHCISVDRDALRDLLETGANRAGLYASMLAEQPHLFASVPVFLEPGHARQIQSIIRAAEAAMALPGFQEEALAAAPEIARRDHGPRGALDSFDFHLGRDGPQLIEINTNAGGALLNTALAQAQRACCPEVEGLVVGPYPLKELEGVLVEMFREEWRSQRGEASLRGVAVSDDEPERQYLHPEFLLFREMFRRAGLDAAIAPADQLELRDGSLWWRDSRIDLLYNRLTDFYLEEPAHSALRRAYAEGLAVVTPNPRGHALRACKRGLALLSDGDTLRRLGAPEDVVATLVAGVPHTELLAADSAERFWAERRQYFFKPLAGHAGKAAYRGDKLTRKVWAEIQARPYVAQRLVRPSERTIRLEGRELPLKLDVRAYVYAGRLLLLAARLYSGQTTNFRTPGGGFAPVFTLPDAFAV